MADHDASPPSNSRPRRAARGPEADADYNNLLNIFSSDSTAAPSSGNPDVLGQTPSRPDSRTRTEKRLSGTHRVHKHRSSGGFLLADPLQNRRGSARYRPPVEPHSYKASQHGREPPQPRAYSSHGTHGSELGGHLAEGSTSTTITQHDSLAGDTAVGSSPRTSIAQLDIESAQIVTMALNLSESRRLASRRNVSQPTPPRLAPLPDGALGGSLRQHLQQQRRASRTVSPRPDRTPRIGGGAGRIFSPLQPPFEPEGTYRYHFSQSTLARAQKAKEYLDLMAQYRRLLELVPPLEPPRTARPWPASPPGTPSDSAQVSRVSTAESDARIGRPYNPLQYIRNRKVRARERKAIDGEGQGFNDVAKVSEWIDEVAKWVATGQARIPGNPALPPFPGAPAAAIQSSPPANNPRTIVSTTKPRRPRVDWVIDPADMIADVYWLELDDNKKLVEDRHWRRIFPQGSDVSRPLSRDEPAPRLSTPGSSAKDLSNTHAPAERETPDPAPPRHDHEHVFSAARDRAQQKLRALKGSHHRHSSAINNRDLLRLHRGSLSESSDTDSDRRRRARSGVAVSTVRSVLERQMEELIAREQRDAESHPLYDHEALRMKLTGVSPMTPERDGQHSTATPSSHPRRDSRAEVSEAESRSPGLKLQPVGRASLEVPGRRRFSISSDTSQPNSPDMRATRDVGRVPAIGMDLSPVSSRQPSPHRNPLTKVKGIFRDRSKERVSDAHAAGEGGSSSPGPLSGALIGSQDTTWSGVSSPERQSSRSPVGEAVAGHRSQKSIGSLRLRGEDGGLSLRSLLRNGPRIDTVLRSGVSKVSDMLWRKESGGLDDPSSSTSSDDSDAEARGRSRGPRGFRRSEDGKSPLEPMPQLITTADPGQASPPGQLVAHPPAQPLSRRSSRFDLLKPPRIDVQHASPSVSPPPQEIRPRATVGSDVESLPGDREGEHVSTDSSRLDAGLSSTHNPRPPSTNPSTHHWPLPSRSNRNSSSSNGSGIAVSRREIARLRALLLSSGIRAMELDRRATTTTTTTTTTKQLRGSAPLLLPPADITSNGQPAPAAIPQTHIYPLTARALSAALASSHAQLQSRASHFASASASAPQQQLERRVDALRTRVAAELTTLAQSAVDAADEANHDLAVGQRLKVKRAVDAIETMLRRRRRRFRWARRAGWLAVEWVLVGFMWYVWFVVVIARLVFGVGRGVVRGVRWLLWL